MPQARLRDLISECNGTTIVSCSGCNAHVKVYAV